MALDALLCRTGTCNAAATVTLTGPLNYQDASAAYVDEIDLHGRMGIDETWAVVLFVPQAVPAGGSASLLIEGDSAATFSVTPTTLYTFTNVVTLTNGRAGNGSGPHLAGYITGPLMRFIRFKVTSVGANGIGAGTVTAALTRDAPLWWRN